MKTLHRPDLFGWSAFDETRNVDFNSVVWVRPGGNVAVDPLFLSAHDLAHLRELGGVSTVVITNSDHVRAARDLSVAFGAVIAVPAAEAAVIDLPVDRSLQDGDEVVTVLRVFELQGSKNSR